MLLGHLEKGAEQIDAQSTHTCHSVFECKWSEFKLIFNRMRAVRGQCEMMVGCERRREVAPHASMSNNPSGPLLFIGHLLLFCL